MGVGCKLVVSLLVKSIYWNGVKVWNRFRNLFFIEYFCG